MRAEKRIHPQNILTNTTWTCEFIQQQQQKPLVPNKLGRLEMKNETQLQKKTKIVTIMTMVLMLIVHRALDFTTWFLNYSMLIQTSYKQKLDEIIVTGIVLTLHGPF
jgi:hypothetical protein